MLADFEIRKAHHDGLITIDPWSEDLLQPVSYDLRLSHEIRIARTDVHTIDPGKQPEDDVSYYGAIPSNRSYTSTATIPGDGARLEPGQFLLACSMETITLSPHIAARVEGKSSLGRMGVQVHITAGFIDPGFSGQITLEIHNVAPWGVMLYPEMSIAQIVFEQVSPPERDYTKTGHYCGQRGPTESRYSL